MKRPIVALGSGSSSNSVQRHHCTKRTSKPCSKTELLGPPLGTEWHRAVCNLRIVHRLSKFLPSRPPERLLGKLFEQKDNSQKLHTPTLKSMDPSSIIFNFFEEQGKFLQIEECHILSNVFHLLKWRQINFFFARAQSS